MGHLSFAPSGRVAYLTGTISEINGVTHSACVTSWNVNESNGGLTRFGSVLRTGSGPGPLVIAPSGRVGNLSASGQIFSYEIDAAGGLLSAASGSPFPAGTRYLNGAKSADDRFVFQSNSTSNSISVYSLDFYTGELTPVGAAVPAGVLPGEFAIDPSGKFLYAANSSSSDISAYSIDVLSGGLTPVPGSPFATGSNPQGIAVVVP